MRCTEPGCTGTIVDGYCDVCGMPPVEPAATPSASAAPLDHDEATSAVHLAEVAGPASPALGDGDMTQTATQAGLAGAARAAAPPPMLGDDCAEPGCYGMYADGYCDVCGAPEGGTPSQDANPGSGATGGSHRLSSAALGSRRAGRSAGQRRTRTASGRTRSKRLGAGLTTIPVVKRVDAASAVLKDPHVPENKRNCAKCLAPVGRSSGGRSGRPEGFCPKCGAAYSFTPKLASGDLVAGQYLVEGALAHGGLGWIYLAKDRNVSDRWVVLKGLLNSGDEDAVAAAIAEQRFLAQVEHPLIVEIYNFVTHDDAGYIVMEYVGGTSVKDILKARMRDTAGSYDPLPVDQALAFIIEILPAFQYLHDLGLVYCDFKPDNIIQVGDAIKLIDLGGVRRIDDDDSAIYGTLGYQAPEVAAVGPSIASDIYTIGRSLLVMCMEFRGYQSKYQSSLPDPATTPIFIEFDSLYWLVAKCCALDPADRFASADELRVQALGVLREVVSATTDGTAQTSAASVHFSTPSVSTDRVTWSQLPTLLADASDPQHAWLSALPRGGPSERLALLATAPEQSAEVLLTIGMERLRASQFDEAAAAANQLLEHDPWDWRALWISGLAAMATQDWAAAEPAFNAVYQQVPGELAPKLALAIACEGREQFAVAEDLYRICAKTDAAYVAPAAFGIARSRIGLGDVAGAVSALDLVPQTSRGYVDSRRLRARLLLTSGTDLGALDEALRSVDGVRMDPTEREELRAEVFAKALTVGSAGSTPRLFAGRQMTAADMRDELERSYRVLAHEANSRQQRIDYVDRANSVRNWSLT